MLGKINVIYQSLSTDDSGNCSITFQMEPESRWAARQIAKEIKALKEKGKGKLVLTVEQYRNQRSANQNRLLWRLLEIMAKNMNGGRTGGVTAWDCYLDMLEKYGAKYEYLECTKEAFPALREMFRAVKVVEERRDGKTVMCKVFIGSSKFDTEEMKQLIDGIFDELADMGIDDGGEVGYYYQEWLNVS